VNLPAKPSKRGPEVDFAVTKVDTVQGLQMSGELDIETIDSADRVVG
jgi:hypothetical protein